MSAPALLHLPAQVVQWLLVAAGQGSDPTALVNGQLGAWPVYADREPDGDGVPDEVLTVYDSDAQDDGQTMVDGEPFQHYGFSVRVRARAADVGRAKAEALRKFFAETPRYASSNADVTVPSRAEGSVAAVYRVYNFSKVVPVRRMGQETGKTRRHLFTVNVTAPVRMIPPVFAVLTQALADVNFETLTIAFDRNVSGGDPFQNASPWTIIAGGAPGVPPDTNSFSGSGSQGFVWSSFPGPYDSPLIITVPPGGSGLSPAVVPGDYLVTVT